MNPAPRRTGTTDTSPPMAAERDSRDARRRAVCRLLLQAMPLKTGATGIPLPAGVSKALAPNPFVEVLLTLYLAELEGRVICQSGIGGDAPSATVHRQAARLEELGAITRSGDAIDHRRVNMTLTRVIRAALDNHVDALEALIAAYPPHFR